MEHTREKKYCSKVNFYPILQILINSHLLGISNETGINPTDIVSTLQLMGLLKYWKGEHMIMVTPETKKMFAIESKRRKRLYVNRMIDPKCLSWTPKSWPIFK